MNFAFLLNEIENYNNYFEEDLDRAKENEEINNSEYILLKLQLMLKFKKYTDIITFIKNLDLINTSSILKFNVLDIYLTALAELENYEVYITELIKFLKESNNQFHNLNIINKTKEKWSLDKIKSINPFIDELSGFFDFHPIKDESYNQYIDRLNIINKISNRRYSNFILNYKDTKSTQIKRELIKDYLNKEELKFYRDMAKKLL